MLSTLFLIIIIAIVAAWFVKYRKKRYDEFWRYVLAIPQPKTYPIIGLLDFLYMKNAVLTFEIMQERMQTFFPIVSLWSLGEALICTASPDDAEQILSGTKHLTKGQIYDLLHKWLGTGLLTSTGSKWHKRRKLLTPSFHFSILQEFLNIFNKETDYLVKELMKLSEQPYVDVVKPITEFTLSSIGETSLGIKLHSAPNIKNYKRAIHDFGHYFNYMIIRPWFSKSTLLYYLNPIRKKIDNVTKILHDFSKNVLETRKQEFLENKDSYAKRKRLAMLDLLLKVRYEDGEDIDDEGIKEEIDTFMFEGHDTTSMALCFMLLVLANEPVHQEEVYKEIIEILGDKTHPNSQDLAEMKFMDRCVKECLRLFPSVPSVTRILGENIKTASGYELGKDLEVVIMIYSMHRSPQIWHEPNVFNPDRFLPENITKRHPFSYLPFSAGPRNCIGQRFALFELKAALCGILKSFKLQPVDKINDVKIKFDLVLRPEGEVRVKFVPRNI